MTSNANKGFTFVPPKPPQVMAADANEEEEEESISINDEEGEEEEALYLHNFKDMTAYRLTHEALEKERALFENLRGAGYVRTYAQLDSGRGNYETKITKVKPTGNLLKLIRAGHPSELAGLPSTEHLLQPDPALRMTVPALIDHLRQHSAASGLTPPQLWGHPACGAAVQARAEELEAMVANRSLSNSPAMTKREERPAIGATNMHHSKARRGSAESSASSRDASSLYSSPLTADVSANPALDVSSSSMSSTSADPAPTTDELESTSGHLRPGSRSSSSS